MRPLIPFLLSAALFAQSDSFVDRMMAFDKNHDGKLTRAEITDDRLLDLFDRADANHDGFVTKEELTVLYTKEASTRQNDGPGGGGPGRGPGGAGGRGGRGGFGGPQAGQIIPGFMQDRLNLTDDQKQKLQALQKEVDAKLDAILSTEQRQQLKQPGGPGGPGGPPR